MPNTPPTSKKFSLRLLISLMVFQAFVFLIEFATMARINQAAPFMQFGEASSSREIAGTSILILSMIGVYVIIKLFRRRHALLITLGATGISYLIYFFLQTMIYIYITTDFKYDTYNALFVWVVLNPLAIALYSKNSDSAPQHKRAIND